MQHESTIFSTIRYIDRENFALDIEIFRNIEVSYYSPRLSAPRAVTKTSKKILEYELLTNKSSTRSEFSVVRSQP